MTHDTREEGIAEFDPNHGERFVQNRGAEWINGARSQPHTKRLSLMSSGQRRI
jgi:hypothetical protein